MCVFTKYFLATALLLATVAPLFSQDKKKVDSLTALLQNAPDTTRLEVLNELFKQYNQVDYNTALGYARQFDRLAKQLGDSTKMVEGGRKIAYSLLDLGKNEEAIEVLLTVLGIAERNKTQYPEVKKQIKFILNNIGLAYNHLGNYDKALEYHYQSLLVREEEGDKKSISTALNNLGNVFSNLKDYKKAIEYYQRAIDTKKEIGDNADLDRILMNLGINYTNVGEFANGIDKFNEGFALCEPNCTDNTRREGLLGLGNAYVGIKDFKKAEECFLTSLAISKAQSNTLYQINNLFELGVVESEKGNDEKSVTYLNEALALAEGSAFVKPLIQIYELLAKIYSKKSDHEKTAFFLGKYTQLKDSIYSDELIKNLTKVQTNFAERENIKTIREKDQILLLKEQLIARQRAQYAFIIVITSLIVVLAAVLLWANKKQRKISDQLAAAKEGLEEKVLLRTRELQSLNEKLRKARNDLDHFLYKTSHDIRGPVTTLKGLHNLITAKTTSPEDVSDLIVRLGVQIDKIFKILTRITLVANIENTFLQRELINFQAILNDIIAFEKKSGLLKHIQVHTEVEPGLKMISDPYLIHLILENLVNNSLKFFNESQRVEPYVKVRITSSKTHAQIVVEDNSVGISIKPGEDVFTMFLRGSERSEIGGVGLYLCKVVTDKLEGTIKMEKTSEKGTTFSLKLALDATEQINQWNSYLFARHAEEKKRQTPELPPNKPTLTE
ncbi:MAG: tetratricopeptide repeat protein [Flammeovirgaceae bacterium]